VSDRKYGSRRGKKRGNEGEKARYWALLQEGKENFRSASLKGEETDFKKKEVQEGSWFVDWAENRIRTAQRSSFVLSGKKKKRFVTGGGHNPRKGAKDEESKNTT